MTRPRLLIITRNLPPLTGGMERLMARAVEELAGHYEVVVIGPRGCRPHLPDGVRTLESFGDDLVSFGLGALVQVMRTAFGARAHLVLAGSGLTAPLARLAAAVARAPYVVLVHGLDIIAHNRLYRALALPALRGADRVVANSENTRRLAMDAGVAPKRLATIPPGVDFPPPRACTRDFRAAFALGSRPVLLSVGRLVARKGLSEFVARTFPSIVARHPETVLAVVGGEPAQALLKGQSEATAIIEVAKARGIEDRVVLCGRISDDLLASAYQGAAALVFPVIDLPGDVEGFGMVAVEAAAHGVATFGFDAGGLRDSVIDGKTGRLLPPGDYDALAQAINHFLTADDRETYAAHCQDHAERLSWPHYGEQLRRVLASTLPPGQENIA